MRSRFEGYRGSRPPLLRSALAAFCVAFPIGLVTGAPSAAVAHRSPAQSPAESSAGLFGSEQLLELTLETDFSVILKDRSPESQYRPATLSYVGVDGSPVTLDIKVKTRGIFRLNPINCQFPPLMLNFAKKDAEHTLFADQDKVKLVTHCRNRDPDYEQYVLQEYLVYRTFNLFTDKSFHVRLASMRYIDKSGKNEPLTKYAFLLEDEGAMAARNGAQVSDAPGGQQEDFDSTYMGLVTLFQYLMGNTDWTVRVAHNIKIIRDSLGVHFGVPYDFDWSGVMETKYARPAPQLEIHTVRRRLYRGYCRTEEGFRALFSPFLERKDAIYSLYRNLEGLSPKKLQQTLEYLDEFYETINDRNAIKQEFLRACRSGT